MFRTHCPSSGVLILYSQQLVFVILPASEIRMELASRQYDKYLLLCMQY